MKSGEAALQGGSLHRRTACSREGLPPPPPTGRCSPIRHSPHHSLPSPDPEVKRHWYLPRSLSCCFSQTKKKVFLGSSRCGTTQQWHLWSTGTQVRSPAWHSGLRVQRCHSFGLGHSYDPDLIPGPGTAYATGHGTPTKKKCFWYPHLPKAGDWRRIQLPQGNLVSSLRAALAHCLLCGRSKQLKHLHRWNEGNCPSTHWADDWGGNGCQVPYEVQTATTRDPQHRPWRPAPQQAQAGAAQAGEGLGPWRRTTCVQAPVVSAPL